MKEREGFTIWIGSVEELDAERAREWRERTPQERADLYMELLRIWKRDAPGLARTYRIVEVP